MCLLSRIIWEDCGHVSIDGSPCKDGRDIYHSSWFPGQFHKPGSETLDLNKNAIAGTGNFFVPGGESWIKCKNYGSEECGKQMDRREPDEQVVITKDMLRHKYRNKSCAVCWAIKDLEIWSDDRKTQLRLKESFKELLDPANEKADHSGTTGREKAQSQHQDQQERTTASDDRRGPSIAASRGFEGVESKPRRRSRRARAGNVPSEGSSSTNSGFETEHKRERRDVDCRQNDGKPGGYYGHRSTRNAEQKQTSGQHPAYPAASNARYRYNTTHPPAASYSSHYPSHHQTSHETSGPLCDSFTSSLKKYYEQYSWTDHHTYHTVDVEPRGKRKTHTNTERDDVYYYCPSDFYDIKVGDQYDLPTDVTDAASYERYKTNKQPGGTSNRQPRNTTREFNDSTDQRHARYAPHKVHQTKSTLYKVGSGDEHTLYTIRPQQRRDRSSVRAHRESAE